MLPFIITNDSTLIDRVPSPSVMTEEMTELRGPPLDLVLGRYTKRRDLDDTLRDALQDRAMRDTIRRVHFNGPEEVLWRACLRAQS